MSSNINSNPRRRSHDGDEENPGTATPTPSGVHTPRPDPTDKRLPGIMHTYFGQVGSSDSSHADPIPVQDQEKAEAPESQVAPHPITTEPSSLQPPTSNALPTAPSSPNSTASDHSTPAPMLPHEMLGVRPLETATQGTSNPYPTPPRSSSNSFTQKELEAVSRIAQEKETHTDVDNADDPPRPRSAVDAVPLHVRRSKPSKPSLSVLSKAEAPAAILSNPTSSRNSMPGTPVGDGVISTALSSLTASLEQAQLTDNVASASRQKATPPQTPRSLSQAAPAPAETTPSQAARPSIKHTMSRTASKREHSPNGTPSIGPAKGKLLVRIVEARGLRPSSNPYITSVFEGNEYISNGTGNEEAASDNTGSGLKEDGFGGVPIQRSASDMGKSLAIPMKSRQSSTTSLSDGAKRGKLVTEPRWDIEATFDVVGTSSEVAVYVYDYTEQQTFLGYCMVKPDMTGEHASTKGWYKLNARPKQDESISGEIYLEFLFQRTERKAYGPDDFSILKLIGKGTFGQVYQVRKKDTQRIYAMKVLSKKVIVQKKEVAHTLGERNILVRTAMADSPFIVGLKFSFQTPTDLYLVTDFMSGGELFWHLQKEGRFNETRAKFYIAELILALHHLHQYNIVYRDLKPENILLDANGHIALCDFGLSKANLTKNDTTNTFCGTTEYLAPEVLLDEHGYTAMVDFWSLGVLVFEMCCGWSPFYAEDTQQMYKNIAFGKVRFPRDALSVEGRNFVKGLLNRNPKHRLGATDDAEELKRHPFFADVDWVALSHKEVIPPFKPKVKSNLDTSNFDPEFTNALENSSSLNARAAAIASGANPASTPLSPGMQANFKGFTFVDESSMDEHFRHETNQMEDEGKLDDEWEQPLSRTSTREDRMSGVVRSNDQDAIFNNGQQFEV